MGNMLGTYGEHVGNMYEYVVTYEELMGNCLEY